MRCITLSTVRQAAFFSLPLRRVRAPHVSIPIPLWTLEYPSSRLHPPTSLAAIDASTTLRR